MKINILKILIVINVSFFVFGNGENYNKLLTEIRKSWREVHLFEWRIYLNAHENFIGEDEDAVYQESIEDYVLPDIDFYKNPNLSGEPYAYVNSKGIFLGGKQICIRERIKESGINKAITVDLFKKYEPENPHRPICKRIPFQIDTQHEFPVNFIFHLSNINGNTGETYIQGEKVYLDISRFKNKPRLKPVKVQLQERYGEEFKEINSIVVKLRKMILKKDLKSLNEHFFNLCTQSVPKYRLKYGIKECEEKINSRTLNYYKDNMYLESLIWETGYVRKKYMKDDRIYVHSYHDGVSLLFRKKSKKWILDEVDGSQLYKSAPILYK